MTGDMMDGNSWHWPAARLDDLLKFKFSFVVIFRPVKDQANSIFRKVSPGGNFITHDILDCIGSKKVRAP